MIPLIPTRSGAKGRDLTAVRSLSLAALGRGID